MTVFMLLLELLACYFPAVAGARGPTYVYLPVNITLPPTIVYFTVVEGISSSGTDMMS